MTTIPPASPDLLEAEARNVEHVCAYTAAVMRACAREWRQERKDQQ